MWIFSSAGFFSVVQDVDDPDVLVVRARIASDLDELRQLVPELSTTARTPMRDYPYRARASREALARGLALVLDTLLYSNFKDSVAALQGLPREQLYAQVWSVMSNAEEKLADGEPSQPRAPLISQTRRNRSSKTRTPR